MPKRSRERAAKSRRPQGGSDAMDIDGDQETHIGHREEDGEGGGAAVDDNEVPDDDAMRMMAESGRRKKRRHGAVNSILAAVGIEEDSESEENLDRLGEREDPNFIEEQEQEGVRIEAFNMHGELENGTIDLRTGVVNLRKNDSDEDDEDWLRDFDKNIGNDQFKTQYEQTLNIVKKREKEKMEAKKELKEVDRVTLLRELADSVQWGETVKGALNRLRPTQQAKRNFNKNRKESAGSKPLKQTTTGAEKETWEHLVEIADALVGVGLASLYEMSKEEIEEKIDEITKDPAIWIYRWPDNDQDFGPFSTKQMAEWLREGYFGEQEQTGKGMIVRKVSEKKFVPFNSVTFE